MNLFFKNKSFEKTTPRFWESIQKYIPEQYRNKILMSRDYRNKVWFQKKIILKNFRYICLKYKANEIYET
jgi:hypothetical protein